MRRASIACAVLAAAVLLSGSAPAFAGPAGDALGKCLTESSTGKDRIIFVRWMFVAFSQHPDLADLARVDASMRDRINQDFAQVV
jgi:hypothetical protein